MIELAKSLRWFGHMLQMQDPSVYHKLFSCELFISKKKKRFSMFFFNFSLSHTEDLKRPKNTNLEK